MVMSGDELFSLFAGGLDIFAEVAESDLESLTEQIRELRADTYNPKTGGGGDIEMTDAAIAASIRDYAKGHVAEFGA